MEPEIQKVDIRGFSFDEFVAFIFDRDVSTELTGKDHWYWHVEVQFDAARIAGYYQQLFEKPEFLLERFSRPLLEEGFWAVHGPNLDCAVSQIVVDEALPLSIRKACIHSMAELFRRLFAKDAFDTSVNMWWDSLCYDWHSGNRIREKGGEDLELQDIYFETLTEVVWIDSDTCQTAALHGLGHLHHPGTKALVDQFIAEHPSITTDLRDYALAAARFEVL
jgi:hypothetical protein